MRRIATRHDLETRADRDHAIGYKHDDVDLNEEKKIWILMRNMNIYTKKKNFQKK